MRNISECDLVQEGIRIFLWRVATGWAICLPGVVILMLLELAR